MPTLDRTLAADADDADEREDGTDFRVGGAVIEIDTSNTGNRRHGGFRFQNVTVPQGATISACTMTVHQNGSSDDPRLNIHLEDIDDSPDFTTNADVTSRVRTTANTEWFASNVGLDVDVATPDFTAAMQELVDRAGWVSGNACTVLMIGQSATTRRMGISANEDTGSGDVPVVLHVTYTVPATTISPSAATVSLVAAAPTIALTTPLSPSAVAVSLAIAAPSLVYDQTLTPAAVTAPIVVAAPTISGTGAISPSPATVPLSASAPVISLALTIAPGAVAVALLLPGPVVTVHRLVSPSPVTVPLSVSAAPTVSFMITPTALDIDLELGTPNIIFHIDAPDPLHVEILLGVPVMTYPQVATPDGLEINVLLGTPHVITGTAILTRITVLEPRRFQGVDVAICEAWWPHQILLRLRSANNVTRSYQRMAPGQAVGSVSTRDAQIRPSVFRAGYVLLITSHDMPAWAGTIVGLKENPADSTIDFDALGWESFLDMRTSPQQEVYRDPTASSAIVRSLLSRANARNATNILAGRIGLGPTIEDLTVGGQSVMESYNELHGRSDWEWSVDVVATPSRITGYLNWERRQGLDLSAQIHLWQGVHFSEVGYELDFSQARQALTVVGDFGAEMPVRNSITRTVNLGPQRRDIGAADLISVSDAMASSIGDLPPGLRNERVDFDVMTNNTAELSRAAENRLDRPWAAYEQFPLSVNRKVDWRHLRVGNYVTIHLDLALGRVARRVRLAGVQPYEERGVCDLAVELPLR